MPPQLLVRGADSVPMERRILTSDVSPYTGPTHPERVTGGVRVGAALEKARVRLSYSLETAASVLGISARLLNNIEAGLRTPTEGLLTVMCERYGLDRARLGTRAFVPRTAPYLSEDETILWMGWLPIQLPPGYSVDYLMRALGAALRTMRSLDVSQPVYLRAADIPLLIGLLDIEDPDLARSMICHLGLTFHESIVEIQRMQDVLNDCAPLPRPLVLSLDATDGDVQVGQSMRVSPSTDRLLAKLLLAKRTPAEQTL